MIGLTKVNDNWVPLQVKVFSRWVSNQLENVDPIKIQDVQKDLSNGVALVELATVLTHNQPTRSWSRIPRMKVEMVQNCDLALDMFTKDGVNFVGISGKDISDNNQKLILGLIWTLILHYSVNKSVNINEETTIINSKENRNSKENKENKIEQRINSKAALKTWAIERTENYPHIHNFSPYDLSLCALLDSYFPQRINYYSLNPNEHENNMNLATRVMEDIGIPVYLYANEIENSVENVDEKTLLTQLSSAKVVLDKANQTHNNRNLQEYEKSDEIADLTEQLAEQEADFKEELARLNNQLQQALDDVEIHKAARKRAEDQLQKERDLKHEAQLEMSRVLRSLYEADQQNMLQKTILAKFECELNSLADVNSKQEEEIKKLNLELSQAKEQIKSLTDTINSPSAPESVDSDKSEIDRLTYSLENEETISEINSYEQEKGQTALAFFSQAFSDLGDTFNQVYQQKVDNDDEVQRLRYALDMAQIEIENECNARQDAENELDNLKRNHHYIHEQQQPLDNDLQAAEQLKVQSLLSALDEVEKSEEIAKSEVEKLQNELHKAEKRNKTLIEAYSDAVESALHEAKQESEDREKAEKKVAQLTYMLQHPHKM